MELVASCTSGCWRVPGHETPLPCRNATRRNQAFPTPIQNPLRASLLNEFFNRGDQVWPVKQGRPAIPGVVIYAGVDGSFSAWDPPRNYWQAQDEQISDDIVGAELALPQGQISWSARNCEWHSFSWKMKILPVRPSDFAKKKYHNNFHYLWWNTHTDQEIWG